MQLLKDKILSEGTAVNEDILKVDSFLNHQVDPKFMEVLGDEIARHFEGSGITRVVTVESSGISPAIFTAKALGVPMVIMKKQPSKVLNDHLYQTMVTSFTKGTNYELTMSQKYVGESDHVLVVDDFLANGETAAGVIRLIRMAHATVAGVAVLIEKAFRPGREKIERAGIEVFSLVKISSMSKDRILFADEEDPE
ncbi:MAG: xanthine phosphoribosyltransferase [Lachnospiraceae bacterium]|nr:xanthine phosphoribosyltransferase [Lachnospiraceae bacterium]